MILSLETSTQNCSIALHNKGRLLASQSYNLSKSHTTLLPSIIDGMLVNMEVQKSEIEAIAVSSGPGSYTGLRIGTSIAKGLCLSLDIPLLSIPTMNILTEPFRMVIEIDTYLIPMIDARRMEVFMMVLDQNDNEILSPQPIILTETAFEEYTDFRIILFGDGAAKCRDLISHPHFIILDDQFPNASNMGRLAWEKYRHKEFENLASFEPNYLKEFFTKKAKDRLLQ